MGSVGHQKTPISGGENRFKKKARRFFRDASGVSGMEYALLGALISVVLLVSLTSVGTKVADYFISLSDLFK